MARVLCVLLLGFVLSGCGQSGDLYLPQHVKPIKQAPDNSLS